MFLYADFGFDLIKIVNHEIIILQWFSLCFFIFNIINFRREKPFANKIFPHGQNLENFTKASFWICFSSLAEKSSSKFVVLEQLLILQTLSLTTNKHNNITTQINLCYKIHFFISNHRNHSILHKYSRKSTNVRYFWLSHRTTTIFFMLSLNKMCEETVFPILLSLRHISYIDVMIYNIELIYLWHWNSVN